MGRDEMRAADSDRQAVADKLKAALDEGRLDLGEYDDRLQRTYAAKTYGDLKGLLDDLPGAAVAPVAAAPVSQPVEAPLAPAQRAGKLARAALGGFGGVFVMCTAIWLVLGLADGDFGNFWPVWLLIPLAAGVVGRLGGGYGGRRDRR